MDGPHRKSSEDKERTMSKREGKNDGKQEEKESGTGGRRDREPERGGGLGVVKDDKKGV